LRKYAIYLAIVIGVILFALFLYTILVHLIENSPRDAEFSNISLKEEEPLDASRVLFHCAQQKYGEENDWKTPDGKNMAVTSIGLYAMNETHYIDNNLCVWIERPPGINSMLSGEELKFYKQKLLQKSNLELDLENNG